MNNSNLIPLEGKAIRKEWRDGEWYFSVVDVIGVLTDSVAPSKYWNALKRRDVQLSTICRRLKLLSQDGKTYSSDCANTEGVLRIIMSVPSPKAEPLKLWMAQTAVERIEETENPELGFDRLKEIYQAKGYTDEWIDRRLQSIETRKQLTDEWKERGVKQGQEYAILTAVIAKNTFGLTPTEHKDLKKLTKPSENLRDHMTPLELIFTALSEEATRMNAVNDDAKGFEENHDAARKGGTAAGGARAYFEKLQNTKVVSSESYLKQLKNKSSELPTSVEKQEE